MLEEQLGSYKNDFFITKEHFSTAINCNRRYVKILYGTIQPTMVLLHGIKKDLV